MERKKYLLKSYFIGDNLDRFLRKLGDYNQETKRLLTGSTPQFTGIAVPWHFKPKYRLHMT